MTQVVIDSHDVAETSTIVKDLGGNISNITESHCDGQAFEVTITGSDAVIDAICIALDIDRDDD